MFPLTATYYDPHQKIWSGPVRKYLYNDKMTIGEVVFNEYCKNPEKIIQINDTTNERMTVQEFLDNVVTLSKNYLKLGLKVGDVVGLFAQNCTHTATVMMASYLCGTPVHALYPGFDKDNVQLIYKITTPRILLCDMENYEIALKVCQDLKLHCSIFLMSGEIEGVPNLLSLLEPRISYLKEPFEFPCCDLDGDDTAVILCSSGTTGTPKGVLCSHKSLLCQKIYLNLKADSVVSSFSTMYWATGLWNLNSSLLNCCLRIVVNQPFTVEYFLELVERHKITHMLCSTTQMAEVSMYENVPKIQKCLASIDSLTVGGSKVPLLLQEKMIRILEEANDKRPGFGVAYGMSELSGMLSYYSGKLYDRKVGTEGKLIGNRKVRIISKNGEFLGPNEHGEITISTNYKWFGYYGNVEATEKAYINNWLHSGDIGFFDDDGFLHVCARDNDVFKARNFQIYPQIIEDIIFEVPGVLEVCVFGIVDFVASNLIACAVVRRDDDSGRKLTAREIISHVESKMSNVYHLSGGVYFLDALPKTGSGKVQRAKILELIR